MKTRAECLDGLGVALDGLNCLRGTPDVRAYDLALATWWEALAAFEDYSGDVTALHKSLAHAAEIRARHMTDAERDAVDAKADAAQAAREEREPNA